MARDLDRANELAEAQGGASWGARAPGRSWSPCRRQACLAFDAERGWHLLTAPPDWWLDERDQMLADDEQRPAPIPVPAAGTSCRPGRGPCRGVGTRTPARGERSAPERPPGSLALPERRQEDRGAEPRCPNVTAVYAAFDVAQTAVAMAAVTAGLEGGRG